MQLAVEVPNMEFFSNCPFKKECFKLQIFFKPDLLNRNILDGRFIYVLNDLSGTSV